MILSIIIYENIKIIYYSIIVILKIIIIYAIFISIIFYIVIAIIYSILILITISIYSILIFSFIRKYPLYSLSFILLSILFYYDSMFISFIAITAYSKIIILLNLTRNLCLLVYYQIIISFWSAGYCNTLLDRSCPSCYYYVFHIFLHQTNSASIFTLKVPKLLFLIFHFWDYFLSNVFQDLLLIYSFRQDEIFSIFQIIFIYFLSFF